MSFFAIQANLLKAPDLLKALAVLSDTIVRRSAADPEDLKPHWKSNLPTIWKTRLLQTLIEELAERVCQKGQAHSSLEAPLEYNQEQMPLTK